MTQAKDEKRKAVMKLVAEAMVEQDTATYHGEGCSPEIEKLGIDITDRIMKIFE